jgi:hypothetical protein
MEYNGKTVFMRVTVREALVLVVGRCPYQVGYTFTNKTGKAVYFFKQINPGMSRVQSHSRNAFVRFLF